MPGDDIVFPFDIAADPAAVRPAVATAGGGPDDFDVVKTGTRLFFRHGGFHDEESRAIPAFVWGRLMPLLEGFAETPFSRVAGAGA